MVNLEDMTDQELAAVGGMPGSLEDYQRTFEFHRRDMDLKRKVAVAQISAARWTKISAIAVGGSVVITAFGIWIDYLVR